MSPLAIALIVVSVALFISGVVIVHLDNSAQAAKWEVERLGAERDYRSRAHARDHADLSAAQHERDRLRSLLKATLYLMNEDDSTALTARDVEKVEPMRLRAQTNGVTHVVTLTVQPAGSTENKGEYL